MRISHVTIRNILGTHELEFAAGKFVEISGPNGSGKSTILEAIKAVFKGGHDATLLHEGAEKGEIVLVMDDGTEVTKTVRPASSDLTVKKDGRRLAKPADLIKSLVDRLSNNPVEFLTAKKEDRVNTLLQSMPLKVDAAHLKKISGVHVPEIVGMHAYQVIEHVYQQVYDDRTGTNRAVDEKEKTIRQLREAIPESPEGVVGGEDELEAKLKELDAQKDVDLTSVHTKLQTFVNAVNEQIITLSRQHDGAIQSYTDGIDAEIAALQKQLEAKRLERSTHLTKLREEKAGEVSKLQARIADVTSKANAKREDIKSVHREARDPFEVQLNILRAHRDLAARRAQTLETIGTLEKELGFLRGDVERQNKALVDIKDYRSELLNNLPIQGLEVRGTDIYRNGVIFDRLNTAQRIDIAVEIAKLRAGELGVICVDGIEALDSDSLEALRQRAEKTELQFFISHVSDQPFQINTDSPAF